MRRSSKHTSVAVALAVLFTVFNVGLPIIVASCPMMKFSSSLQCMMCDDGSDATTARISNFIDKSCCETKFAAERNTNEFLQAQLKHLDASKVFMQVVGFTKSLSAFNNLQAATADTPSPPRRTDIPISNSALLI